MTERELIEALVAAVANEQWVYARPHDRALRCDCPLASEAGRRVLARLCAMVGGQKKAGQV
jgi:hypothetical protein